MNITRTENFEISRWTDSKNHSF